MKAGRLRHRIRFEENQPTQSRTTGALINNWVQAEVPGVVLTAVPAEVLTGPGREHLAAGAKFHDVAARINLRWFPGFKPAWRLWWDGQVFEIISWSTDATGRRELRLVCRAGVSNG